MKREEYFDTNYEFDEIEDDPRFKVCEKEMKLVLSVQLAFTFLTIAAAYILGRGNPADYTYILGIPAWWLAVILISFAFFGIVIYIVKFKLQDMSLTDEIPKNVNEKG